MLSDVLEESNYKQQWEPLNPIFFLIILNAKKKTLKIINITEAIFELKL